MEDYIQQFIPRNRVVITGSTSYDWKKNGSDGHIPGKPYFDCGRFGDVPPDLWSNFEFVVFMRLEGMAEMVSLKTVEPEPDGVSQLVEHLFRHEGAKMVAILTRIFGIEHLNLAEDVVQEALVRALQTWPFYGVPKNPSAWIMRASRNLALDVVRRRKVFQNKQAEIIRLMDRDGATPDEAIFSEDEISDDRLRLMFVCCHPAIPAEAQVALALKTLCGFSVEEIGHAFLTTDAAIAKRLTRAKQKIHQARIPFEIPAGERIGAAIG